MRVNMEHPMALKFRSEMFDWGKGVDHLWTGDDYEVAYISAATGRRPIEVRRAIMKVGADRKKVIAELQGKQT
jgi:Protein of unknown function (DUF3606)